MCIAEILDRAEEDGISQWEMNSSGVQYGRYPAWIEEVIAKIIAQHGYSQTMKMAIEVDVMDQKILLEIMKRIRNVVKCEGWEK